MKRNQRPKYAFYTIVSLIAFCAVANGLIRFVKLKNDQIEVSRQIEEVEDQIAEAQLDIQMERIAKSRLLNRFQIAQRLKQQDSNMIPITFDAVETLPFDPSQQPEAFASTQP